MKVCVANATGGPDHLRNLPRICPRTDLPMLRPVLAPKRQPRRAQQAALVACAVQLSDDLLCGLLRIAVRDRAAVRVECGLESARTCLRNLSSGSGFNIFLVSSSMSRYLSRTSCRRRAPAILPRRTRAPSSISTASAFVRLSLVNPSMPSPSAMYDESSILHHATNEARIVGRAMARRAR